MIIEINPLIKGVSILTDISAAIEPILIPMIYSKTLSCEICFFLII